jgi:hypothetical protein
MQEQIPREYDERSVVAWIKQARGGAISLKAYEDERKAVAMEKLQQKGRIELAKVSQRLKTAAEKSTAKSGPKWVKEITSRIRTGTNDLFNTTTNAWDMSKMDTTGFDPERHMAHRISQEAIRMMISGEQTEAYTAIMAAAKKNGVDIAGTGIEATEKKMQEVFGQTAAVPDVPQ